MKKCVRNWRGTKEAQRNKRQMNKKKNYQMMRFGWGFFLHDDVDIIVMFRLDFISSHIENYAVTLLSRKSNYTFFLLLKFEQTEANKTGADNSQPAHTMPHWIGCVAYGQLLQCMQQQVTIWRISVKRKIMWRFIIILYLWFVYFSVYLFIFSLFFCLWRRLYSANH